jgi:carboxymethylenebutenolidase
MRGIDMVDAIHINSKIDRYRLPALRAVPANAPKGGVVVIQEVFGLTAHIAEMTAVFADAGYAAIAPGLFDRVEPNFHAEHDQQGFAKAMAAVQACSRDQVASDLQAAIDALPKPVYVTGFCYGGAMTWLAAARCGGVNAAACFYGRLIADMLDEKPKIPVMLHYGARDASIPPENVERVRLAAPNSPLYLYDAGHGFCRPGADYDGAARDLAVSRTLDWFARWP